MCLYTSLYMLGGLGWFFSFFYSFFFFLFLPLVIIIKGYYSNRSYLWNGSPLAPSVQIFVYAWLQLWLFLIVLGQP